MITDNLKGAQGHGGRWGYCKTFGFEVHEDELARAICKATKTEYKHTELVESYTQYRNKEGTLFSVMPIAVKRRNRNEGVRTHNIESGRIQITPELIELVERILEERQNNSRK